MQTSATGRIDSRVLLGCHWQLDCQCEHRQALQKHWRTSRQWHPIDRDFRRSVRRALTLIEILVVITLLVVAVGAIVPRMGSSLESRQLREAAGRFVYTAKTVRELAVARQQLFAIEIDLDRRTYGITMLSDTNSSSQAGNDQNMQAVQSSWLKAQRWPKTIKTVQCKTPEGTIAESGTMQLKFLPDGTSSGISIRLLTDTNEYNIVVYPHNGRTVFGDAKSAEFPQNQYDLGD